MPAMQHLDKTVRAQYDQGRCKFTEISTKMGVFVFEFGGENFGMPP